MPNVVFDTSSLVGALLKSGSVPERALLLARAHDTVCLSAELESEIREVFARPKFARHLRPGRVEQFLALVVGGARWVEPIIPVTECRDAKDNKVLALALAAQAAVIVASDADLLVLNPFREIAIVTPAEYVR